MYDRGYQPMPPCGSIAVPPERGPDMPELTVRRRFPESPEGREIVKEAERRLEKSGGIGPARTDDDDSKGREKSADD
jgi:hypothetical protein